METLFNQVKSITRKYAEIDSLTGSNFNLFKILDITSDEVRLHTMLLADLLNPNGSHGQGGIFLEHFVKELGVKNFDVETASVHPEMSIGGKTETTGGRIDLFIKDAKGCSITIENKIYAKDQENQLLRYYNYSSQNLFYLNLLGTDPSKQSIGTLKSEDYTIISYKEHIISWLETCRKEAVELPLLREGISHYINLVKTLVGQSRNKAMTDEIRDLIVSKKENLESAIELSNTLTAAKIKLQYLFWEELKNNLEKQDKYEICENDKKVNWQKIKGFYGKRNKDIHYGYWMKIYEKDDITIHYGVEIESNIYHGFTIERNGKGGISNLDEFANYRDIIQEINSNYKSTNWWMGWRYPNTKLNFKEFNSQAIFNLCDRNILKQTVEDIVRESFNDIESFLSRIENMQ